MNLFNVLVLNLFYNGGSQDKMLTKHKPETYRIKDELV